MQWDNIPSMIMVAPISSYFISKSPKSTCSRTTHLHQHQHQHQQLDKQLSPIHKQWVYDPLKRQSNFDSSTFNLLHHIPDCIQYLKQYTSDFEYWEDYEEKQHQPHQGQYQQDQYHYHHQQKQPHLRYFQQRYRLGLQYVPLFSSQYLQSHHYQLRVLYQVIRKNIMHVKLIEDKLNTTITSSNSRQLQKQNLLNVPFTSIETIINIYSDTNDMPYLEDRVICTTAETLARLCDAIQSLAENPSDGGLTNVMKSHRSLKRVCRDYLSKIRMLMDIERVQSIEDLKAYDMYSCQFEYIEIPPPRVPIDDCICCCSSGNGGSRGNDSAGVAGTCLHCAYHMNLGLARHTITTTTTTTGTTSNDNEGEEVKRRNKKMKPTIVNTEAQFQYLTKMMVKLKKLPGERVIGYLSVPGVAENRPLVSIGDMLRLRFGGDCEIIGEVGDVQVKTETIMIFLPIPSEDEECKSYVNSLLNPKNKLDVKQTIDIIKKKKNKSKKKKKNKHNDYDSEISEGTITDSSDNGRFDVRFGLFNSR